MSRAEFRVFGHGLIPMVKDNLWKLPDVSLKRARDLPSEFYLVSPFHPQSQNIKLRHDLLEIKRLHGVTPQGFELYRPDPDRSFPLTLDDPLKELLQVHVDRVETAAQLLVLMRATPGISVIKMDKKRYDYKVGEQVHCEHTLVYFNDLFLSETVCVESESPDAMVPVIAALGLAAHANKSYVQACRQLVWGPNA